MAEHKFELHVPPRAADGAVAIVDGAPIPLVSGVNVVLEGGQIGKYAVEMEIHPSHEVHMELERVRVAVNIAGTREARAEIQRAAGLLAELGDELEATPFEGTVTDIAAALRRALDVIAQPDELQAPA